MKIIEILVYILAVSLATIIPPFVAIPLELVAVDRYGFFLSFIYTILGNVSGALVAFLLARKFGWSLINKLFNQAQVNKVRLVLHQYSFWHMTWTRMAFASISDVLSYACGLTRISLRRFLLSTIIANAPISSFILIFGNRINLNRLFMLWLTLAILITSLVIVVRRFIKAERLRG